MTITTNATTKVVSAAAGFAMAFSMLAAAPLAHAQSASDIQTQINSLLSTIQSLQSQLAAAQGGSSNGSGYTFTRDLTVGSKGADVTALQNALLAKGYSIPAGATGTFGSQTRAAVVAWQKAMGVSPAAGYFGSKSRAVFGQGNNGTGVGNGGNTGGPITGNGLKVSLSPTSPNNSALVQGQGIGDLGDYVFSNPTSMPIMVTAATFNRIGVSNDSTLNNVYLYQGVNRITDSAGVSSGAFTFTNPSGIFTVPAGSSVTISVRADIAASTAGQVLGVSLVTVSSNGTLDASTHFPINSGFQTIAAATLATVQFAASTIPTSATSISPQGSYPVWQNTVSVSTNPVRLMSMRFTNLGSINASDVSNFRLFVDGTQVGNAVMGIASDRSVTFDLSAAPAMLSTQSHVIKVLADITGGASRTIQLSVQRSSDALFVDQQLGQPVTTTTSGSSNYSAATTGAITINSVSGTSGVSVSLDAASPSSNVPVGATNVKLATFDLLASGESVKINDLYVEADTSVHNGGLDNGKVYVNGAQVGSTKDIAEGTGGTQTGTDFSLGSSLILPAGQIVRVDIYGDTKTSTSTSLSNSETVKIYLDAGSSNAQGQSSLNAASVPGTSTGGNTVTLSSSSLAATKYSGYGNQTMIAGTNNARLGAFTLSTGSTEGVTVNTIGINLTTANAASVTNLWIKDDSVAGGCASMAGQIGSVISTPSTANTFSVTFDVPASATKTIDVCGNILSGVNAGSVIVGLDYTTGGTGDVTSTAATVASSNTLTSPTSAVQLQTITVGSGTLTVTRGAGDPTSGNVVAGASSVRVGQFNFAASNSSYTVKNLAILIANGAATSVTNVTLQYKDVNGVTQTATQALSVSATNAYSTATFTGLTAYVPSNDSANIDVYVGVPTIASGATSGAAINVLLSAANATNNNFQAQDSSGSLTTAPSSLSSNIGSNGTFYVRKSLPTFAKLDPGNNGVPSSGSPLYRFSITADPAGAIEWSKIKFNIATATASVSSVYLVDELAPGVNLLDNNSTSASTTATTITIDLTKNATASEYQQIAAGATKTYDVYGTVTSYGATGSSIVISVAQDSSAVANNTAQSQSGNFIWSDRSAVPHTAPSVGVTSSSDFTTGYLVQNLTTTSQGYSK